MKTSEKLNKEVWATIKPSNIHGIGVFAIRDIPKGTKITTNTLETENIDLFLPITEEEFNNIIPEIQEIILDRMLYKENQFEFVINPNAEIIIQSFMNHSSNPNTDGRITLSDIKKGEELTEDYTQYLQDGHKLTKKHIQRFIC